MHDKRDQRYLEIIPRQTSVELSAALLEEWVPTILSADIWTSRYQAWPKKTNFLYHSVEDVLGNRPFTVLQHTWPGTAGLSSA